MSKGLLARPLKPLTDISLRPRASERLCQGSAVEALATVHGGVLAHQGLRLGLAADFPGPKGRRLREVVLLNRRLERSHRPLKPKDLRALIEMNREDIAGKMQQQT